MSAAYAEERTIEEPTMNVERWNAPRRIADLALIVIALIAMLLVSTHALGAGAGARTFATPEEAADALVQAVKSHNRSNILSVLGNVGDWIRSGDAVADRATGDRFVAAYEAKHALVRDGDKVTLTLGNDNYPFAFPMAKVGDRWRFDSEAGREEMLARRIGENELAAIEVLQAIVDAQIEYAREDRNGDGVLAYAQKFASSPGKRDGLYWQTKASEPPSPMGSLVAHAAGEGYRKSERGPTPYHGYYFHMLRGQGKNAASGALDYVVKGRAIGGFAVVAYPAKYGNSGIMTFIVNQDGKVYQKDLGRETASLAATMRRFDPGPGWAPVDGK